MVGIILLPFLGLSFFVSFFFFFNDTATTEIYTLSLHDALPILGSTGYNGNLFGMTALGTVLFQSGAIYAQSEGSNPFGAAQPQSVVTFQAGSRYRLDGNITPSFSGRTYADFQHNTAGPTTTTGGGTLTMDHFIVTTGVMNCNMTGVFNLRGNLTVNAGA